MNLPQINQRNLSTMSLNSRHASRQSEVNADLPQDSVTLSGPEAQRGSAGGGLILMMSGLMIGGGIATAAPIVGGVVMLGSIFAGLSLAGAE